MKLRAFFQERRRRKARKRHERDKALRDSQDDKAMERAENVAKDLSGGLGPVTTRFHSPEWIGQNARKKVRGIRRI